MRGIAALMLLGLPACQLVFDLETPKPASCKHDGLLLCLSFEDAFETPEVAVDDSGNGLDASVTGASTITREGPTGLESALDLTADSVVVVPDNAPFDIQPPISIDLWVRYRALQDGERNLVDNTSQYTLSIQDERADIMCTFTVATEQGPIAVFTGAFVLPEEWHHVACTFDGVKPRSYSNGADSNFDGPTASGTIEPEPAPLTIGNSGDPNFPRPFVGQLDNVRIWTRVLDAEEINEFSRGIEGP